MKDRNHIMKSVLCISIAIVFVAAVGYVFEKKYNLFLRVSVLFGQHDSVDDYESVDDLSGLKECIEDQGYYNVIVSYARSVDNKHSAYIILPEVDSIDSANGLIVIIRDYFENHPNDPLVINDYDLLISMGSQGVHQKQDSFSITYQLMPSMCRIESISQNILTLPDELPSGEDFSDVERVYIWDSDSVSESDIVILESIYPYAHFYSGEGEEICFTDIE